MPLQTEDSTPLDITGDSSPGAGAMSPRQIAGMQHSQVNRTQAKPVAKPPQSAPAEASGQPQDKPQSDQAQPSDKPKPDVSSDTPILGGLQAIKAEADAKLHFDPRAFNPYNAMDWAKQAAETPVETYQFGRHVWNAYYGAFLDPNAITTSLHNIRSQDAATEHMAKVVPRGGSAQSVQAMQQGQAQLGQQLDSGVATALTMGANPENALPFGAARGLGMVSMMLGPSVAQAMFGQGNSNSELLWGGAAAMLFGGKLPPSIEAHLAEAAPGALRLFDKIGATQRVQDLNKVAEQDRQQFLNSLLKEAQPQVKRVIAPAWQAGMEAKGMDWEKNLSKQLMDRYGTLDRERLIPQMVRDGATEQQLRSVWTHLMKMPYDLLHVSPAEEPLVNPVSYLSQMPKEVRAKVEAGHQWTLHMVNQAELGPAGHAASPEASHWRSLIGHQNTNDVVHEQWVAHLEDVAGEAFNNPTEMDRVFRAVEGDQVAYQGLSPQLKYVRDSMRLVAAGLRRSAADSGYSEDFVHNFWARVPTLVGDAKQGFRAMGQGGDLLSSQIQRHRPLRATTTMGLEPSADRMQVEQRYPTVQAANAAQVRLRTSIVNDVLNGSPIHEITGVPETEQQTVERIRSIAADAPEVAKMEAEHLAEQIAPNFSTNPFDSMNRVKGYLKSITAHRAVNNLLSSVGKDGKAVALLRPLNDERALRMLFDQGYRPVNARGFNSVLVSNSYADLLERATKLVDKGGAGAMRSLADLEGTAVATIMYSPRIHGMNMAARMGILGVMHPLEVTKWLKAGLLQKVGQTQVGPEEYRLAAWRAGVIPPHPGMTGWADRISNSLSNLTGDADLARTPLVNDLSHASNDVRQSSAAKAVLGSVKNALWGKQSDLWSWVSDFGVMAYHIEQTAAMHGGMSEQDAAMYAARRANSWMGHVAPEDTNPNLHALAKTITFAPNYWRTWGELLTGIYKRGGFGWSPDTIKYIVQNEVRTALAAVAFQQLSANALNLMMSGHTIYQNDPGNWGKVEITAPWAVNALNVAHLGIDPKTGRNAKGQKLTMENPVARQMVDTEQALGLLTSAPSWSPSSLQQGASAFSAGRESPVIAAIGALINIDMYASIAADGIRYMDPNHDNILGNPALDAFMAMAQLTPFSYISNQIQQSMVQGQNPTQEMQGPFGLKIPKVVSDTLGGLPGDAARMLMVGLSGINPPYERSSKTMGVQPTDDQYQSVNELQTTYTQNMNALSTSALSGQMTPDQWVTAYRTLSTKHADQMQAIFKHAPEYNNGPLGLTNSWEGLYDQASKNGVTDADKLRVLQRQWRNSHSSADYAAVQSELRVSDQKYPMLALYHKTLDAFDNWQNDYAKQNNVDLETLRNELTGYGQVYNDRIAADQYLAAHPDIQPYENAKKSQFEAGGSHYGEAGLMYALFFNPTGAERYLNAASQTPQQVEQATTSEQVPTAP